MSPDAKAKLAEKLLLMIVDTSVYVHKSVYAHKSASNALHAENVRDVVAIINATGRNICAGDIAALLQGDDALEGDK